MRVKRIISGAQTGADRAALDVALALGIDCGGWVPRGRIAEDGIIPAQYQNLRETESADVQLRTERNVLEADATLIVSHRPLGGAFYQDRRPPPRQAGAACRFRRHWHLGSGHENHRMARAAQRPSPQRGRTTRI